MNKAFEKILERLEVTNDIAQDDSVAEVVSTRIWNKAIRIAKQIVNEAAEEYNGGWIPCSKGLPKVNEKVLTTHENGMVQFATFTKNKNFVIKDSDGDLYIISVIAWQPLPEPYKERD